MNPHNPSLHEQSLEAARQGNTGALALAIKAGLDCNLTDLKGDSLLMLAAYHGHPQTVELLLDNGADPNLTNAKGQHPLTGASYKGQTDIVKALLAHGADPEGGTGGATGRRSPLMYAALYNHVQVLRALLDAGADPARRSADGEDALSLARSRDAVYCIELLDPTWTA